VIRVTGCLAFAASLLIAGSASATMIDFTSAAFAAAHGQSQFSTDVGGVGVTVLEAQPIGAELYLTSDGIGVDSPWGLADPGEINVPEELVISFDQAQFINEVYVTQLFQERGWLGTVNESGWYSIDGGDKIYFEAAGDPNGLLTLAVGQEATSISFGAKLAGLTHDFSVQGMNVGGLDAGVLAIPEPLSSVLFAIGAMITGAAVRRRLD